MNIPRDPFILFSYINTNLRDTYSSLDDLCAALELNKSDLTETLNKAGFEYDPELNRFV